MNSQSNDRRYLVANSQDLPLARAVLESPPDNPTCQFRILDDSADHISLEDMVQLVPMSSGDPPLSGRIITRRGNRFVLEQLGTPNAELRRNLRIPASFKSYIYPLSGSWTGRRPIVCEDISCGGIAFTCAQPLENGELVEAVVPICEPPLILQTEILRPRPSNSKEKLYASKFVDLLPDEEAMVREAVFSIQVRDR